MKKGFTMIELIFVIVILGILAAVAIPKMAATRDDAKVASIATQAQAAVGEVPQYVTAHGGDANKSSLVESSQVLKELVVSGKAVGSDNNRTIKIYGIDGSTECLKFHVDDENLTVTHLNDDNTACKRVNKAVAESKYQIAGTGVEF